MAELGDRVIATTPLLDKASGLSDYPRFAHHWHYPQLLPKEHAVKPFEER
jgi:hypothetical protein